MNNTNCFYCLNEIKIKQPFCERCGGRPAGESATELALSGLMLVERLIPQRIWFGLEKEIAAIKLRLEASERVYSTCKPALDRLVEQVGRRLEYEPNIPQIVKIAKLVFGLVRGYSSHSGIREMMDRLERFTMVLQETEVTWSRKGHSPSQRKAMAWFEEQAERAGLTVDDAHESLYETPELWPTVAATVDPGANQLNDWKVEVAEAEVEAKTKNYGIARTQLADILSRDPSCTRAHEALAQVLKAMGQTSQAIDHFREAVQTGNATPTAWNNLAWYLVTAGRHSPAELDEALWAAHRAVALVPLSSCWDTLAEVLYRRGDVLGAIVATREAIRINPQAPSYRKRMQTLCDILPTLKFLSDTEATSTGYIDKDVFEDTDFSVEIDDLDADGDDRTVQIDRASDFDLEESDSDPSSEVFTIDEDDVDQNAATGMGAAIASDDSGEFEAKVESGSGEMASGWDIASEEEETYPAPTITRPTGSYSAAPTRPDGSSGVHVKTPPVDRVQLSLYAPSALEPGGFYALDVWAYLPDLRDEVMARARESQGTVDIRVKTKDGVILERGVVLTVRLDIPTMVIADPEDMIDWNGESGNATFPVSVPAEARPGPHAGTATFHVDQIKIAKLHFVLEVGRGNPAVAPLAAHEVRCKCAFASYASEDRDEVLGRLQGIMKILPDLDLFLDVASLRSGDRWEERLYQEIAKRDTLYLFWSSAASRSTWVEREWRTALALKGIESIDPVPLVSPHEVPPPTELAQLHFNDWLLAFTRGGRGARSG